MIINRLPEIGEAVVVAFDANPKQATVISMADCKRRAPTLFGRDTTPQPETYRPDDCIRAWLDEEGKANFCIMRFGTAEKGFEYNKHIHAPEETKPMTTTQPTDKDCAEMTAVVEATDTAHGDWGEIVAAVTGDPGVQAAAMNRASVRAAVQVRISCQCGSILDTRSAMLVEDAGEKAIAIVCGNCVGKYRTIISDSAARVGKKGDLPPGTVVAYLRFGSGKQEEIKTP